MLDSSRMWLSTRTKFRQGDAGWDKYAEFIQRPTLREVRSIDAALNSYVNNCGSFQLHSWDDIASVTDLLPVPDRESTYYLLFLETEHEGAPPPQLAARLLGYDLSDETMTSSLLNCGAWKGPLLPIAERHNAFGLLSLDDALTAKKLLPAEWPNEPHGLVTVWALYEVGDAG